MQPEMLGKLRENLTSPNAPQNIELIEGDAAATTLGNESCDLVLMANLWHELDDHAASVREAARILREGGRLAILDWRPDVACPPGPPLTYRISAEQVEHFLKAQGWSIECAGYIGRYSYLVIATAPSKGAAR